MSQSIDLTPDRPRRPGPLAAVPVPMPLFVVPHAGGSAAQYRGWSRWLPADVRLVPLELPGHASRMREPLLTEWPALVSDVLGQIRSRLAGAASYALAGHSLGALLAYEAARALVAEGTPPVQLVVTGRNGPSAGLSHRPIHQLPDAQFLRALERLGGTPDSVLVQPDLMRFHLPQLRADLRLAETYVWRPGPPLPLPVAAFAGRADPLTDDTGLIAWRRVTADTFELTVMGGGHFFHDEPAFRSALRGRLGGAGRADGTDLLADVIRHL